MLLIIADLWINIHLCESIITWWHVTRWNSQWCCVIHVCGTQVLALRQYCIQHSQSKQWSHYGVITLLSEHYAIISWPSYANVNKTLSIEYPRIGASQQDQGCQGASRLDIIADISGSCYHWQFCWAEHIVLPTVLNMKYHNKLSNIISFCSSSN